MMMCLAQILVCFGVTANLLTGVFPPEIRTVAIVSPAAPPDSAKLDQGIDMAKQAGLKVKVMPHARKWQDSGYSKEVPAAERAADLEQAWLDPEVDLIWCSRGGDWSEKLLPLLDWKKL
ncbi:MAG: LD-carboxypeptidase, partial [Victivallaceae bacterium]|nr:LD-carboxypeptidase [Victivallaceae bacterium]